MTGASELVLTKRDALFVSERAAGSSSVEALITAYRDDEVVKELIVLTESKERKDREYAKAMLRRTAWKVSKRRGVKVLTDKYTERMQQMGDVALETLEELMVEGTSEKVRADVAIEVTRHNLGSPDKDRSSEVQQVIVIIGEPPKDLRDTRKVQEDKNSMTEDVNYNQKMRDAHEQRRDQRESAIEAEVLED